MQEPFIESVNIDENGAPAVIHYILNFKTQQTQWDNIFR